MKMLLHAAGLIVVLIMMSEPLSAQWPVYATSGVPRTPDGELDLEGPVPPDC